jgi:serine/threonine protein kinase
MDETTGFGEETIGEHQSLAARDLNSASTAGGLDGGGHLRVNAQDRDHEPPTPGPESPETVDATPSPADRADFTHTSEISSTAAQTAEPDACQNDLGATGASEPSFVPPPDPNAVTSAGDAPLDRTRRSLPAIPGYEILGELGRGAMGVVYHAREVRLNRPCAIKMILAGAHASPEAASRFLVEAEAVAKLHHPNVVQIHRIGEAGGLPFLELEYLEGGSRAAVLDGTPWPAKRAAALVESLARAIAAAHAHGLLHRDLKPSNILLSADGVPKIIDFGLAKILAADSRLTATGSVLGTPSYMAPEQAEGHAKEVGPAADTYAQGAILYELLTGRPPFRGRLSWRRWSRSNRPSRYRPRNWRRGCRATWRRSA